MAGMIRGKLFLLLSSLGRISSRLGEAGGGEKMRLFSDGENNEFYCLFIGGLAMNILSIISSCFDILLVDVSSFI
jgi:hypothetical protein